MPSSHPPLLQIAGATVVKHGTRLLDDLHLTIPDGQHTAILGPNGSGKSSLMKLITRRHYPLARPDGAPVASVFGRVRWDVFSLRSQLGIVSADEHSALAGGDALTGRDTVISGFFASRGIAAHHTVTSEMKHRADWALTLAGAAGYADRPLERLSTGEARRVLIARALAPDPKALLLDEPTAGLDLPARRRFLETLSEIARSGKTIVLVTHHVEEVLPEIGQTVLLHQGKVFRDGPTAGILTSEMLSALFGEPIDVQHHNGVYSASLGAK